MILPFILIFGTLQLLDWYTTYKVLQSGKGKEANPIAAKGMDILGINGYLGLKAIILTYAGYFVASTSLPLIILMIIFYGWVVSNNIDVANK